MKKGMKWTTIALLAVFFVGLSVLLYPSLSNYWNSLVQTEAITDYEGSLQNLSKKDYEAVFAAADKYNQALAKLNFPYEEYEEIKGYEDCLNVSGNGMMGYVSIGKIGIELPIYHGTSTKVLNVACGHLEGTSLPVGGEGTHCTISAHRGLPSAKLFTDLDRLEIGDTFTVTVLDRVLTYEVDQIRIVQPEDVSLLSIVEGEDYFTLLTCTPYGINTERLLVRGTRTDTILHKTIHITTDGHQIDTLIVTPIVALPMLLVMMLVILFKPIKKDEGDDF